MKTIGLLGGMTWESSVIYYQLLNRAIHERLGGVHSARLLMHSFDFAEIARLQEADRWDEIAQRLISAGKGLVDAGADFLMICCNTQHLVSAELEHCVRVPLLHIADPLGRAIATSQLSRIALMGTRYTMEMDGIVAGRLEEKFGIEIVVPRASDRAEIHRIIFEELARGRFLDSSRQSLRAAMARLVDDGAQGIILGCTELPIIIRADDASVPLFDTTALHAMAAVEIALGP